MLWHLCLLGDCIWEVIIMKSQIICIYASIAGLLLALWAVWVEMGKREENETVV